jgi:hypothetical protein
MEQTPELSRFDLHWGRFNRWFSRWYFELLAPVLFITTGTIIWLHYHRSVPPGVYIAFMGLALAIFSARHEPRPLEKGMWIVLAAVFMAAELSSIYSADAKQTATFDGISTQIKDANQGIQDARGKIDSADSDIQNVKDDVKSRFDSTLKEMRSDRGKQEIEIRDMTNRQDASLGQVQDLLDQERGLEALELSQQKLIADLLDRNRNIPSVNANQSPGAGPTSPPPLSPVEIFNLRMAGIGLASDIYVWVGGLSKSPILSVKQNPLDLRPDELKAYRQLMDQIIKEWREKFGPRVGEMRSKLHLDAGRTLILTCADNAMDTSPAQALALDKRCADLIRAAAINAGQP